jgi:hypothetical protein
MNRTAIALVMLLPSAAGCRGSTDLVSKECGAAITMPARPVYEPSASVIEGKTITSHQYRALRDGITYGFVCTDAPLMEGKDPEELLDSATQGFLMGVHAELITEHNLSLQSIRGRELVMKTASDMMRNRTYLLSPNSTIDIWVRGADVGSPAADRFFDSLRLVAP